MYKERADKTCEITGARLIAGSPHTSISHFVIDSREVSEGSCFVAFKGESHDANDYLVEAIEKGASAAIATRMPHETEIEAATKRGVTLLFIEDAEVFLQKLARWFRKQQLWFTIGVTGSCGKTTVKTFLQSIFSKTAHTYATPGNFNSTIGVPLSILQAPEDTEVFIAEMGMNHPGEIDCIASCARPHIAIITNIGSSHIGILKTQENIARAKSECVAWLAEPLPTIYNVLPTLIMPEEDAYTSFIQKHFAKPFHVAVDTVGESSKAHVEDLHIDRYGNSSCKIVSGDTKISVSLAIPGVGAVEDALLAYEAAAISGLLPEEIKAGLESARGEHMRMNVLRTKSGATLIDDSYNAAPASIQNAAELLMNMEASKRIIVLGEMAELGEFAEAEHVKIAKKLLDYKVSKIIFVGDELAKVMQNTYAKPDALLVSNYQEAYQALQGEVDADTALLIKGSRFLELDKLAKEVQKTC